MDRQKLKRIRKDLDKLWNRTANIHSEELERAAMALGRSLFRRGKEPNYVSDILPNRPPISIPHHGSRALSRFTAESILNDLEDDFSALEEILKE
jgi:hypothetical protein